MTDRRKLELAIAVYILLLIVFVVGVAWMSRPKRERGK
jgi:hypothetical protein